MFSHIRLATKLHYEENMSKINDYLFEFRQYDHVSPSIQQLSFAIGLTEEEILESMEYADDAQYTIKAVHM
ncbi:hypothetical protein ABC345_08315 [Shouchella sp. 1P09AA]|uniref:hypothetical protein n=1 Tax=unclassified Shouchella TaxID=2893065 RepID=UPI00399FD394